MQCNVIATINTYVWCEQKGFTALHISAKYGTVRVARIMIKKGADVSIAGKNGLTPLHVAAHYNHSAMVTLLLASKASPHSVAKVSHCLLLRSSGCTG